jgi:hypothetical protein
MREDYPNIERALPKMSMRLLKEVVKTLKAGEVRNPHSVRRLAKCCTDLKRVLDGIKEKSDGREPKEDR